MDRHDPVEPPNYARRRLVVGLLLLAALAVLVTAVISWLDGSETGTGTGRTSPTGPSDPGSTPELVAPPQCAAGDSVTELAELDDWQRTVVDTERRLPAEYVPDDLVDVEAAGFEGGYEVREFLVEDLAAMRKATVENGTPVEVISAYRSAEFQDQLFEERTAQIGLEATEAQLARPGHSEHQLGTTLDFGVLGSGTIFDPSGAQPEAVFLADNAHRFGFIVSYPLNEKDRTCYIGEPWHFRYFGRELAARIHSSGLTAREYLWHWQETGSEPPSEP